MILLNRLILLSQYLSTLNVILIIVKIKTQNVIVLFLKQKYLSALSSYSNNAKT